MIFKGFIFVCTIVWIWSCGARCENDAPSGSGKSSVVNSSKAELQPVNGRKVDINQVKPMVENGSLSGKDHRKNNTKLNLVKSSLNVNVNHGGFPDQRWHHRRPNRYGRLQGLRDRKKRRLLQLIDALPISNIDYNVIHPDGNVHIHRKKHQTRKAGNKLGGFNRVDFAAIESGGTECYPVLVNALEYLQRIEINLRNVERKLKKLLPRFPKTNAYENFV